MAFFIVILSGCSQVTLLRTEELRKVQDEVKGVHQQVETLQKSVDELNLSQGGTTSKMKADLTLLLHDLQNQITRLQAQIDETQYRLNTLGVKIDKLDQKKIILGGPSGSVVPAAGSGAVAQSAGAAPGSPSATVAPRSASPAPGSAAPSAAATSGSDNVRVVDGLDLENLFNQARDDYIRGKYDLALQGFKTVYEKDGGGTWRELAMFWLGETLVKQDKVDRALEAYQRVVKEFPRGNKSCAAHFKVGLIHHQRKDKTKRDEEWAKLITECPGSNEAQRAQEMQKE